MGIESWNPWLIWIELTLKGHPIALNAKEGSIIYRAIGCVQVFGVNINIRPKWKVGDIIECGIKFAMNFINDGNQGAISATIKKYILKNLLRYQNMGFFQLSVYSVEIVDSTM